MPTTSPTQRLAQAAKQYMAGEIPLRDYQAITRELTPDYAQASMQVASWGWLSRLFRPSSRMPNPIPCSKLS